MAVSAVAPSQQLDVENRAEKGSPAVLLEVKDLRAVVRETGMEILKGVDLVIREGEVRVMLSCMELRIDRMRGSLLHKNCLVSCY